MSAEQTNPVLGIPLLAQWEGKVEQAPGVLFGEVLRAGSLQPDTPLPELAAWLGFVVGSGPEGGTANAALRSRARAALRGWRDQAGESKLQELQERVTEELRKYSSEGRLQEEQVTTRIEAFFGAIRRE